MIKYLLEDEECVTEFENFVQTYINKKIDEIKIQKDSNENL